MIQDRTRGRPSFTAVRPAALDLTHLDGPDEQLWTGPELEPDALIASIKAAAEAGVKVEVCSQTSKEFLPEVTPRRRVRSNPPMWFDPNKHGTLIEQGMMCERL
jgi:hypothetical protein